MPKRPASKRPAAVVKKPAKVMWPQAEQEALEMCRRLERGESLEELIEA